MGSLISLETFEELVAHGRQVFTDGLIRGDKFASTIRHVVETSYLFGRDEAERSKYFFCKVDLEAGLPALIDHIIFESFSDLFQAGSLKSIIDNACRAGAAFGFQAREAELKDAK